MYIGVSRTTELSMYIYLHDGSGDRCSEASKQSRGTTPSPPAENLPEMNPASSEPSYDGHGELFNTWDPASQVLVIEVDNASPTPRLYPMPCSLFHLPPRLTQKLPPTLGRSTMGSAGRVVGGRRGAAMKADRYEMVGMEMVLRQLRRITVDRFNKSGPDLVV